MSFDKNWEKLVYKKSLQINQYPFDWIVSSTFNQIKRFNTKKVLELGCGTGNNLRFFRDLNFKEIIGVDGSKTAIKLAKKNIKSKKIKLIQNDFSKINFKSNYFDLIVDRGSITHNSKKEINQIFDMLHKFLKKDGLFFSTIFSSRHYGNFTKIKNKSFKDEINSKEGLTTSFFNQQEIKRLFSKFKIISLQLEEKKSIIPNNKKNSAWWLIISKK